MSKPGVSLTKQSKTVFPTKQLEREGMIWVLETHLKIIKCTDKKVMNFAKNIATVALEINSASQI